MAQKSHPPEKDNLKVVQAVKKIWGRFVGGARVIDKLD
jgi:hypothetical protein